ncbi:hypothetical protein QM012_004938 [Aureobasidium pullulans]|uniref:EF-hand n=1 Tax=Aureobasidium pullulans TaxID=5580 RepID=A0ABR0T5Z5_AURPU
MAANASSSISRPWVLAATGFVAAYTSYVIWSNWPSHEAPSNLRRRGAVRSRHNTRPQTRIWTSDSSEPSLPFGLVHVDFEGIVVRFPNGPEPPTVVEIAEALNLPSHSAYDVTLKIQETALKHIFEILIQPAEELPSQQSDAAQDLQELAPFLRQPNINELLARIHILCSGPWKFHRAAVARAFAEHCGLDRMPIIPDEADLAMTETAADSDHEDDAEPAQGIKSVVYHIAEEKTMRQLYVHTGIRCEQCGQCPILGVRWHCNNCPDFDLCSTCEAQPMHTKTHVFTKIKIPMPFLGQNHQVQDVSYPGDPMAHWPALRTSLKKQLAVDSGFEDLEIQVFYDQFGCKANVAYPEDPMQIGLAIERHAFNKLLMSPTWKRPVQPNVLYDRVFSFYDTDGNGLIGFKEYVLGIAYLRQPNKQTSLERIFLGYDFDGDGYISRRDFIRMLSAKYAIQKKLVEDTIEAAEIDMVTYTENIVRSSQPISAAFAQEDVPPGQTRPPTMKVTDRFGESQVQPDAGPFASAVLPDGLELPDSSLVGAIAHRYGVDALPENVDQNDTLSIEQLTAFTSSLNRSDSVAVDGIHDGEESRFMVDTDFRQLRSQSSPEEPEQRWHQDLVEASRGGRPSAEESLVLEIPQNGEAPLPPLPADVLERGRAYEVPAAEKDFGSEVIFQVVQEGLNELIDPIFAKKERLAEQIRATREERRRFRQEIDEYVLEAKSRQEELLAGSEVDPLMAIANAANNTDNDGHEQQHDSTAFGDTLLQVEPADGVARLPTPREIAIDLQEHIVQQSQALNDNIEDLESNIREQSLDDLLAQSGYIVDFSSDTAPASTDQPDDARSDTEEHQPSTFDDLLSNLPAPEGIPIDENDDQLHAEYSAPSTHQSPPTRHLQAPFSTPDMDSPAPKFAPFRPTEVDQSDSPSQERLRELARLDEEEKDILVRGGPGRLNFEEFEQIIRSDKRGMLQGAAESWLEWAEL